MPPFEHLSIHVDNQPLPVDHGQLVTEVIDATVFESRTPVDKGCVFAHFKQETFVDLMIITCAINDVVEDVTDQMVYPRHFFDHYHG